MWEGEEEGGSEEVRWISGMDHPETLIEDLRVALILA